MSDFVDDLFSGLSAEIVDIHLTLESWDNFRKTYGNIIWTTQNGLKIPLMKLETSHLENIIHMLKRNKVKESVIRVLERELYIRQNYSILKKQLTELSNTLDIVY
jgi:uncharacterized protein YqgQ